MQFEFSNINTQYTNINPEIIASISKENANSAKSNVSSVNIDAAVLSISGKGSSRINAMMSKSIQLRATANNPSLTAAERLQVNNEIRELRVEMDQVRDNVTPAVANRTDDADEILADIDETSVEEAEQMVETSTANILKHADESIKTQTSNTESVLQLL